MGISLLQLGLVCDLSSRMRCLDRDIPSPHSPILIASIPEDTPGPGSAVDDHDEESNREKERETEDKL